MCRAGGAGGRGGASPLQRGAVHPRSGRWAPRWGDLAALVGVRRCLTRPARQGRPTTTGVRRRSVLMIDACRDATRMGRAVRRGRARRRLAPTTWRAASPVGYWGATGGCNPRHVGVRRCLTRPARRAGNACQWVPRCGDDHGGGGWERTPGAEAPGSVRKPPEGGSEAPRRPGRSAGCRRRWGQPASAGLGTEPGRSRPGDRGEGCSADLRCVSGETCRRR